MLPCQKCRHRRSIPGDAHSLCAADWAGKTLPAPDSERVRRWFLFPANYDPVWGPDSCECFQQGHGGQPVGFNQLMEQLSESIARQVLDGKRDLTLGQKAKAIEILDGREDGDR